MNLADFICGVLVGGLLMFIAWLVFAVNCTSPNWVWQKQAIENGAAEWRIDGVTGKTEFHWLTKAPPL